nr:hypothetical protein [Tanacetum cinerariifolium]
MAFSSSSSSSDNGVPSCSKACSKAYSQLQIQYHTLTENFLRDTVLTTLRQKLDTTKKERGDLNIKLEKFQTSSKRLTDLLANQTFEKAGIGYHAVPPLITGTFMPPKPDLVFHTPPSDENEHLAFNVQLSLTKPEQDLSSRPSEPIIEDWVFDSKEDDIPQVSKDVYSSAQTTKHVKPPRNSVQPIEALIPATTPKPTSPKTSSSGKRNNKKTCFVCRSVDHLIKDCNYHTMKKAQPTIRNYAHRGTHKQNASFTHHHPQIHMVPVAVLSQSKPISTAVRPICAAVLKIMATKPRHARSLHINTNSIFRRHITHGQSPKISNSPPRVTTAQAPVVSAAKGKKGKWVWRPKCPILDHNSSTTGLPECADDTVTDYSRPSPTVKSTSGDDQNINSSASKNGESIDIILSKPAVKFVKAAERSTTNKVETVKKPSVRYAELYRKPSKKPNVRGNQRNWNNLKSHQLGSSQNKIDDKGYWDSGCSRHMTGNISYLSDYEQFDGGYVSFGQGGCKITRKGTIKTECIVLGRDFKLLDDANILLRNPRRLGHLNFETMNKLVRHNLVRGLPTKCFENDHTCTACLKGKQYKASCKSKLVNYVSKPLHTLHMDLFGPTSVSSISHKWYCLVVTDDFSRKVKEKGDEGYFIGYLMSSKAFRVFNKRTRRVKENLHVEFLENKAIEKGVGPNWLFDIDSLTKSMNYVPVDASTISTNLSGTKDAANQEVKKYVSSLRYIALPNWAHDALLEYLSSKPQDHCSTKVPEDSGNPNPTASTPNPPVDRMETLTVETPISTVSSPVPTAYTTDSQEPSSTTNSNESNRVETDISNMDTAITASPTPTLRIHKDHPKSQIIGPVDTPIQTRNKSKDVGEQSFIATIHQKTHPALL